LKANPLGFAFEPNELDSSRSLQPLSLVQSPLDFRP
jgi:hypothetical protein